MKRGKGELNVTRNNLKTEYLYNPMGLDIEKPRLFWNADGKGMQKAYEIEYL